jgi:hypothetical protein
MFFFPALLEQQGKLFIVGMSPGEHLLRSDGVTFLDMEGVSGSIPLPPTTEKPNRQAHFYIVARMPDGGPRRNVA